MVRSACKGFPVRFVDAEENRGLFRLGGRQSAFRTNNRSMLIKKKTPLLRSLFILLKK